MRSITLIASILLAAFLVSPALGQPINPSIVDYNPSKSTIAISNPTDHPINLTNYIIFWKYSLISYTIPFNCVHYFPRGGKIIHSDSPICGPIILSSEEEEEIYINISKILPSITQLPRDDIIDLYSPDRIKISTYEKQNIKDSVTKQGIVHEYRDLESNHFEDIQNIDLRDNLEFGEYEDPEMILSDYEREIS